MDVYWRYSIVHLRWYVNNSITLITLVQAFKFDSLSWSRVSFTPHFQPVNAYFTQLSPCWGNSDDVFDIMGFNIFSMNLSKNLSSRYAHVTKSFFLIRDVECVVDWYVFLSESYYKTLLNLSDRTVSMTVIVSTTIVGWRRSCWDSASTTPDWSWFLTPTRRSLVNCCLFLSKRSTWSYKVTVCLVEIYWDHGCVFIRGFQGDMFSEWLNMF